MRDANVPKNGACVERETIPDTANQQVTTLASVSILLAASEGCETTRNHIWKTIHDDFIKRWKTNVIT